MKGLCFATLCLLTCWAPANAQGEREQDTRSLRATITGNQEQPKVLYIVPWKSAQGEAAIPYRPISGQTDNVFRHLERSEHLRHLELLETLEQPAR